MLLFSFSYCFLFFFFFGAFEKTKASLLALTDFTRETSLEAHISLRSVKEPLGESTVVLLCRTNTPSRHCYVSVLSRGSRFAFSLVDEVKHTNFLLKGPVAARLHDCGSQIRLQAWFVFPRCSGAFTSSFFCTSLHSCISD